MTFAFGETVTVLAAGQVEDEYGNATESWDSPTTVAVVEGVGVEPRPSGETFQNDRNASTNGYTLYDPSSRLAVVQPEHRIEVRGSTWPVIGDAADWRNPFTGWTPGVVVQVGRTDG